MTDLPDENFPLPNETLAAGLFEDLPKSTPKVEKSYRVLARKYRPQNFDDLIGQEALVRTMRNAFAMGRVAHAFMLTGVRGVGKTTTARIIARALNCVGEDGQGGPTADPCGVCPNCKAILADRHPDVLEIDAASHTGVDDVREIIEGSRFRPLQARMKVYIIDEVHMLSRNAFNALLKTLEEPPEQVTFIFATTEIRKVPVTVLSRCQRFDLRRVPQEQLQDHFAKLAELEHVSIALEAINLIARAADGSVRDGLSLLDQAIAQKDGQEGAGLIEASTVSEMLGFADRALVFDLFKAMMGGKPDKVLELTDQAYATGADLGVLLTDLLDLVHLLSRMKAVPTLQKSAELSELERVQGGELADKLSVPVLGRTWQMLLKGTNEVDMAPNRKAAVEMVLIRLCYVSDLPSPDELIKQMKNEGGSPQGNNNKPHISSSSSSGSTASSPVQGDGDTFLYAVGQNSSVSSGYPQADVMQAVGVPAVQEVETLPEKITWQSWREVVVFVKEKQERLLHAHLRNLVHLVKFAPPTIEIRVEDKAPNNLAQQLSKLLNTYSNQRWTIVLSQHQGEPSLMEQESLQAEADLKEVGQDPFILGILEIFPGARLGKLVNPQLDEYGLFPENIPSMEDDEGAMRFDDEDIPPYDPDEY
ncbi:DNA polymerase III subunit gamma/tau [Commensalibacter papalotli (ex Botero et al. 2024)]|uniref:DNA polymerase III subunit gamma/tau n=1 Tax=Commensalibacter papalotli (ex Botero et al. 2024) TaxID=2972766 RepID=A0ABM9HJW2_9PROT|nr:DNA polymerase III subunit gamma/tau [Commensalibacter papalotli (ex Botero et al. 2024)]CAI3922933.1 DNA polymerase III [Commensalibacter papalotli (ex Botero et al. 2024)]CAI3929102.1 DNA polymerase III [Commensalibacter papalotli (ex Botero et al. 2024)]